MFLPCLLTLCDEEQQRAWVPLAESKKARPAFLFVVASLLVFYCCRDPSPIPIITP